MAELERSQGGQESWKAWPHLSRESQQCLSHLWQHSRQFVRLVWKWVWEGAGLWLGAGAEGAVPKDQQLCLHLAARVTLSEEISPVHEPRELSAWCHAAGEPFAAGASLLQSARNGRSRQKSRAKLSYLYQGLCELRLAFSLAGRGGCSEWEGQKWLLFVGTALRQPWGYTGKYQGWIWVHKALLCLQSTVVSGTTVLVTQGSWSPNCAGTTGKFPQNLQQSKTATDWEPSGREIFLVFNKWGE